MKKFLVTISAMAIAFVFVVGSANADTIKSQVTPKYLAPMNYSEWVKLGNTYPAGFELLCFNYTMLSEEGRAKYVAEGEFDKLKNFGEFTLEEMLKEFAKVWTNGGSYFYTVSK